MARRKVGRYNEVKVDLASYDYYLRGEGADLQRKVGIARQSGETA